MPNRNKKYSNDECVILEFWRVETKTFLQVLLKKSRNLEYEAGCGDNLTAVDGQTEPAMWGLADRES